MVHEELSLSLAEKNLFDRVHLIVELRDVARGNLIVNQLT